jgi:hypothetical protein
MRFAPLDLTVGRTGEHNPDNISFVLSKEADGLRPPLLMFKPPSEWLWETERAAGAGRYRTNGHKYGCGGHFG